MPPRIRSITPDSEELDELEPSGESEFEQESEQEDELEELRSPAPAPSALKIKFKLSTATYDPPATSKGKGKQRQVSEEEELSEFDSDEDPEDHYSDQSAQSSMSAAKLTARQRAKEMGGDHGMELQSLPPVRKAKTTVKLSDAEAAFKKAELSRKRKHQLEQKLEDEKTETINRLLKKQVAKSVGRQRTNPTAPVLTESGEIAAQPQVAFVPPPPIPTTLRYVSSIKAGEYSAVLAIPVKGRVDEVRVFSGYPGPRPPLKTRRLEKV